MHKLLRNLTALISVAVLAAAELSAENIFIVHADRGTYNQGYKNLYYLDNNETSFGMGKSAFGFEYSHIDDDGISTGGGFAFTNIEQGRKWNLNHYETHPATIIMVPYIFTGYEFDYFGCELGISCYLQFSDHEPDLYYLPDGSYVEVEKGGIGFDRGKSYTFINANVRLFRENSIHCRFRIGRENFDPIDSLINLAVVLPVNNHQFEYYLSFMTPMDYLDKLVNQKKILKANQTTGLCYMYSYKGIGFGVKTGALIYNAHGGAGTVPFVNRFTGGLFTVLKW